MMTLECDNRGQVSVLTVNGDLVSEAVGRLRETLEVQLADKVRDFVIVLKQLGLVDSQGLDVLMWLHEICSERLGQVRLVDCSEDLQVILNMTRMDTVLQCHQGVDDAMESLK